MATADLIFDTPALNAVVASPAPIVKVDGTNIDLLTCEFVNSATTRRGGKFTVPTDIGSGTVTFRAAGRRKSGTSPGNIVLVFEHTALADSEAEDTAYTAETSAALAVDTTDGDIDILTWSETVANMAWTANQLVFFRIARNGAAGADTLTESWNWGVFTISVPLA